MATEAELDQLVAVVKAKDFDQARLLAIGGWDELFWFFAYYAMVVGSDSVFLEDLGISESWNLDQEDKDNFGGNTTFLFGVPDIDQAVVTLPVTSNFIPTRGYRWVIANGSSTNRLQVDPQGAATIDGASAYDIEPLGTIELIFEGTTGREHRLVAAATAKDIRIPLVAADCAAGLLDFTNPFGVPIIVEILLDVTTPASGAHTADFGQAATAVSSDNLMDQVDLGAAAGVFSSHDDQGTNGRTFRRVAAGEHVTGSTFSGASAGLVGNAFLTYRAA